MRISDSSEYQLPSPLPPILRLPMESTSFLPPDFFFAFSFLSLWSLVSLGAADCWSPPAVAGAGGLDDWDEPVALGAGGALAGGAAVCCCVPEAVWPEPAWD